MNSNLFIFLQYVQIKKKVLKLEFCSKCIENIILYCMQMIIFEKNLYLNIKTYL